MELEHSEFQKTLAGSLKVDFDTQDIVRKFKIKLNEINGKVLDIYTGWTEQSTHEYITGQEKDITHEIRLSLSKNQPYSNDK